jgi:ATP-dependent helicase/nuclease subunit A
VTPAATLADQPARDRIRRDLDTTLIVEAAAGTGKTTELVNRVVAVIASGRATLDRTVAVTFTEKAAGELKLRLRAEIERARHDPAFDDQSRRNLLGALPQLEEARIGTIHSFCSDLLRERPVEAGVDPMFEVAPEDAAESLFDAAFNRWFEQALAAPGEGVRRILCRRDLNAREGPRPILRAAAYELLQWRDFDAAWPHEDFARDAEIDRLVTELLKLGELAELSSADDPLQRALDEIGRAVTEAIRLEPLRGRDYDALEAVLLALLRGPGGRWRWRGWGADYGPLARDEVVERRDRAHRSLEAFRDQSGANLAPLLREELSPVVTYYAELKRRAGLLDFLDLLLITRDLVRGNAAVRGELQQRFSRIFIDEFQDTDPLQAEVLLLLAADDPKETDWTRVRPVAGRLFIVGDPKQSIYRFRRADVSLYQGVKQRLRERGAALEHLTVSFRAVPELQRMVNAAFAPLMAAESPTQPAYAQLDPCRADHESQPPIVALPVPEPYGQYGRIVKWQLDESLPNAVAAFVRWLVEESGWTVTERDRPADRVALRPRHICILFRRLNAYGRDVTRPYIRALEARHIAHVLVRGGSFNEREEVEAIRNALGAIERPDDELLVFATLKGPLFALSDAALLEFRETRVLGSLHPFRKLPEGLPAHLAEVGEALKLLRGLHRGRNRRPIADTISRLLSETRAHAGIAIWPTGEQALANVTRLMDQARRYEARSGATSFRGFVDELEARAERVEASEAPVVEEGTEGVRIMTVHRAKGLEFPVVILADITCNETRGEPQRFIDPERRLCAVRLGGCAPRALLDRGEEELRRDQEEAIRVLYVAATRARDLLVVPVVGDEPQDGWLARLNPALYPDFKDRRAPLNRQPPGCLLFGDDSVLKRPPKAPPKAKAVAPGLHRPQAGAHRVVWWDPFKLDLDVRETMGLRQHKLLQADESGQVSERGKEQHRRWSENRAAMLVSGGRPAITVATATELAIQSVAAKRVVPEEIEVVELPRVTGRPHGVRFGTLVHGTLLRVAFGADRDAIAAAAGLQGRMLGAPQDEVAAAVEAVAAALQSPLMISAARAVGGCRRECPVLVRLDDGVTMEGIADLAFVEAARGARRWVVVDFKTDVEIAPRLNEYRAQLGLYIRGITASTGDAARGVLLWV